MRPGAHSPGHRAVVPPVWPLETGSWRAGTQRGGSVWSSPRNDGSEKGQRAAHAAYKAWHSALSAGHGEVCVCVCVNNTLFLKLSRDC